ncbi:MAG: MMPL family transporter, partial [Solirubrobacteraceae bacterium]
MKPAIDGLQKAAARRPGVTIAIVLAAAIAGAVLALGLKPSAGTDTFVSRSSASYRATIDDYRQFGGEAVVVLIREPLRELVGSGDLTTVAQLEACLGGQVVQVDQQLHAYTPAGAGARPYGGFASPCGKLMQAKPVQVVYGPGTFLNRAVAAVNVAVRSLVSGAQQSAQRAASAAYARALATRQPRRRALADANAAYRRSARQSTVALYELYLQSGIQGTPNIDDPQFIDQIVFGQGSAAGAPQARFAYLFPTAASALIQVRLKASLSYAQQAQAIGWIREAVRMPAFRLAHAGAYTVTGEPVVVSELASAITGSIAPLLLAAVGVMAIVLTLAYRRALALAPLAIALAAVAITLGVASLAGAALTMASIAAVPVLIGLAVDYGIQLQPRVAQAGEGRRFAGGATGARPAIGTAALASAAGFLALGLSPVPMVRGFGVLLVLGIAVAFACALAIAPAWPVRVPARDPFSPVAGARRRALRALARRPLQVLAVAGAVAAIGWVADTRTAVQSDVTKLVP